AESRTRQMQRRRALLEIFERRQRILQRVADLQVVVLRRDIGDDPVVDRVGMGRPAFDDEHLVENSVEMTVRPRERNDWILIRYRREELTVIDRKSTRLNSSH